MIGLYAVAVIASVIGGSVLPGVVTDMPEPARSGITQMAAECGGPGGGDAVPLCPTAEELELKKMGR